MSAFSAAASDEDGDTIHTLCAAIQQAIDWIAEKPDLRPTSAGRMVGVLQNVIANAVTAPQPQPDTGIPASVPPGWQLVPVEPTEAMLDAAFSISPDADVAYQRMLTAAPQPPVVESVAWQCRTRPDWDSRVGWSAWESCAKERAQEYWKHPALHNWQYEARALYTRPQPRQPLTDEMVELGWELHGSSDAYQAWSLAVEWTERVHGIGGEA